MLKERDFTDSYLRLLSNIAYLRLLSNKARER